MNTKTFLAAHLSCAVVVAYGVALALPVAAQDNMQGMQMSRQPAKQSSATASASSAPSMQGMDMSSMPAVQMPQPPAQPMEMQRLRYGNMLGTRPEPGGLAEGMQGMSMQGMEKPSMQSMDMSSMQGGSAPPNARSPDYSDGYTYGPVRGMDMADDVAYGMAMLDQFEYAHSDHGNAIFVDGEAYYGSDFDKLWLKAEGERSGGKLRDLRIEALWDHAIATYWSTQLGARHDFGEGPDRNWAVFGVQGLAPYWFEIEAFGYVGENGRTAARLQAEYEELLTQKLILQPKIEINLYGRDDPQRGIGSGLSDAEFGLRLRYEIRRELAPYIGIIYRQRYGRTADFARAHGEAANDLQFVAGLHIWF